MSGSPVLGGVEEPEVSRIVSPSHPGALHLVSEFALGVTGAQLKRQDVGHSKNLVWFW